MAHDFDYPKNHSRPFYAPKDNGTVRKGQVEFAHSIEDEARVKQMGFTSKSYVKSSFPTTRYNKNTGEAKIIGDLQFGDEKNMALLAALGPEWVDYPVEAPPPKPAVSREDNSQGFMVLLSELQSMRGQMTDIGSAVDESAGHIAELRASNIALERRLGELEAAGDQDEAPPKELTPAQKAAATKAAKEAAKGPVVVEQS